MEQKCVEFKAYLRSSGIIDALNGAIVKLYELPQKPENPLKFLSEHFIPNGTDDTAKKLIDAQATIQILKNGRDLDEKDPNSIEKAIEKLQADESCKSLLKKHLKNKAFFDETAGSKKQGKQLLFDCVKIGLVDHKQDVGLLAADAECYSIFSSLFEPIIEEIHGKLPLNQLQPTWEYDVSQLVKPDIPYNEFIEHAVITCRRSLPKTPFRVKMTNDKYFSDVLQTVFTNLLDKFNEHDLKNVTYKFEDLGAVTKADLLEQKFIFDESEFDETLEFVGAAKFWPIGRAAIVADDKSYVIWVNRIDHLEFKSFDKDVIKAIERISTIGNIIDKCMKPLSDDKYGWLTCSPKYIGNAMTVSVFIKLTKLSGQALDEILNKYNLIINSTEVADEGSKIYEIQNKSSLCTQLETMENILAGIAEIIENEKKN